MYTEHNFDEFDKAAKDLFKSLFGEEFYDKLNSIKIESIDWKGLDINECFSITATTPNIKDRFTKEWIEYFQERNYTLLDLYLQSVHHYGFYNAWARQMNEKKSFRDALKILNNKQK